MENELADFLRFCGVERRLAPLTCKAYERDIRALFAVLRRAESSFFTWLRAPDLRLPGRRSGAAAGARQPGAHGGVCVENEHLERDPALVLRTPKKREVLPDVLDRRELGRLLAATERDDVWERQRPGLSERDRLMLAFFACAGLRRSELLGLDWDDVDLERRLIRVRNAKGQPPAQGSDPPGARAALSRLPPRPGRGIRSRRSSSARRAAGVSPTGS
jgi:site-specific recombinase XerC